MNVVKHVHYSLLITRYAIILAARRPISTA